MFSMALGVSHVNHSLEWKGRVHFNHSQEWKDRVHFNHSLLEWRDRVHFRPRTVCSVYSSNARGGKEPDDMTESLTMLLDRMKNTVHETDTSTYARILRVCGKFKALQQGRRVHGYIRDSGHEQDRVLGNHLVEMYLRCGSLREAQRMFDEMAVRDAVLWTSMITAYSERGFHKPALKLFHRMKAESVAPDNVTFVTILNCCGRMGALQEGKSVHSELQGSGFANDVILKTALLNMYGKCGSLTDAREVFESIEAKDMIAWNAMLSAYVQHGAYAEALELYESMTMKPNLGTYVILLNSCAGARALEYGREVHSRIRGEGLEREDVISSSLFNMYGKCGSLEDAYTMFLQRRAHDRVAWAHMMFYYTQENCSRQALWLFRVMLQEGVRPEKFTFTTVLSACDGRKDLPDGKLLHECIQTSGFESDVVVRSALIHMYGRCDSCEEAWDLFLGVPQKNVLLSSAMIATCARYGQWKEILKIYNQVRAIPYKLTILNVLKACTELEALEDGQAVHEDIKGANLYLDKAIRENLIHLYCKCGKVADARLVFDGTADKSASLWNVMIEAYVQDGQVKQALELFEQMHAEGVEVNEETIAKVLLADGGSDFLRSFSTKDQRLTGLCRSAGVKDELERVLETV